MKTAAAPTPAEVEIVGMVEQHADAPALAAARAKAILIISGVVFRVFDAFGQNLILREIRWED